MGISQPSKSLLFNLSVFFFAIWEEFNFDLLTSVQFTEWEALTPTMVSSEHSYEETELFYLYKHQM